MRRDLPDRSLSPFAARQCDVDGGAYSWSQQVIGGNLGLIIGVWFTDFLSTDDTDYTDESP